VRDEQTGNLNATVQHPSAVTCFKYDERRQILVTGCNDFKVRVWDLRSIEYGTAKLCCALSASNHVVYYVDCDEDMIVMTNAQSENPCTYLWDFRDSEISNSPSKASPREIVLLSAAIVGACFLGANSTPFPYLVSAASTAVVAAVLWRILSR
jgi:WD40 repeat protein